MNSTLIPNILQRIVSNPVGLSDIEALLSLGSSFKEYIPHIKELRLSEAVPLSKLLELLSPTIVAATLTTTPLLSGLVVVDVPTEVLPWEMIAYKNLTLCLTQELHDPKPLLPLFQAASKDPTKRLEIYDQREYLIGEAAEGYVSEYILYVDETVYGSNFARYYLHEEKVMMICEELDIHMIKGRPDDSIYKAIWLRGQWIDSSAPSFHFNYPFSYPNLESVRADCPYYVGLDDLIDGAPKLRELGPMFIVAMGGYGCQDTHPSLQTINLWSYDKDIAWALKEKYDIVLYVRKSLLPLYETRYGKEPKIVGFRVI